MFRPPAAVALALTLSAPLAGAQATNGDALSATVLDNGLQVVTIRNGSVPFVTTALVLRAGAFTQASPQQAGLPHLIEHLLFRTSDAESFDERAAKIEADWNGATGPESVKYYLNFPARHLANGIELLADLVRRPRFTKEAIEAEGKIVRGELERRASDPDLLLMTTADMLLWQGPGWTAKNPGGNLIAVLQATPRDLEEMYRKYYVPNNALLIVAGDVTDTAVVRLARKSFGSWRSAPDPMASTPPPAVQPLADIQRKVVSGATKDVTLVVRWHGPSAGTQRGDTYAADVVAGLVNHPLSTTQQRLVDGGLVDDVWLSYDTRRYVGEIELTARTSPDRAAAAAAALGQELSRLVQPGYFTDDDLVLARKRQAVNAQFRAESAAGSAHVLGDFWTAADLDYYRTYHDSLNAQGRADVRRFVERYLQGKPMVVTVLIAADAWTTAYAPVERAISQWRAP